MIAGVRGELEAAAGDQPLIRVSRGIRRSDEIDGFVVGLGQAWVLLAVLDPTIDLNGYVALRLADVSKVERRGDRTASSDARSAHEASGRRSASTSSWTTWRA